MADQGTEIIIRNTKNETGTNNATQNLANTTPPVPQHLSQSQATAQKEQLVNTMAQSLATQAPEMVQKEALQNLGMQTLLTAQALNSPADYIFHFAPETMVDKGLVADFQNFAFEQKMSLENARLMAKFYENYVQNQSKKQLEEQTKLLENMKKACEADSEYGGSSFYDNMQYARAAILRFDDGSLAKILNETGFGSHPEVVRFMYRVGKALAEPAMPRAKEQIEDISVAELFYPSMKK